MTIPFTPRHVALFQSVRSSRDFSLVAFAGALLTAAALQMGAFVPRLASEPPPPEAPRIERVPERREPAVVAARRTPPSAPAQAPTDPPARAAVVPCDMPRG